MVPELVRVSVWIEHIEDIKGDVAGVLEAVRGEGSGRWRATWRAAAPGGTNRLIAAFRPYRYQASSR